MTQDTKKGKNKAIKLIIETGITTLILYIGISTCSKSGTFDKALQVLDKNFSSEKKIEMMQELEYETGISTNNNENMLLLHAVLKNDNLDEWGKNILYGFDEMIKDNPYIPIRGAYKTLEDISIEYIDRPAAYSENIYGIYSPEDNTVYMFNDNGNKNIDILKHELVHGIFNNRFFLDLPKYFIEGTTEMLVNEYFSKNPYVESKSYPYEVTMMEVLCDMIGSDKILEAYTKGDINIVVSELSKKIGMVESVNLLLNIDNIFKKFKSGNTVDKKKFDEIMNTIGTYFANTYSDSEDDVYLQKFLYSKGLLENMLGDNPYENYLLYIEENGVYKKPYFSSKLKQRDTTIKIINLDGTDRSSKGKSYSYTYKRNTTDSIRA